VCNKEHAKELHKLLTKNPISVKILECVEDNDIEGCVNVVFKRMRCQMEKNEGCPAVPG
jgi:hypothetical protein